MLRSVILSFGVILPVAGQAEQLRPVTDRSAFLSLIEGRELRRFGIRLNVLENGRIEGRAMGRPISGNWHWKDRYFCRDMQWGDMHLAYNCQTVRQKGQALRFTSDQGQGDSADLRLE